MNFLKTSLHWLRWDLRRFRLFLRIWVLLLAAFTLWVGYVNWKILTIDLRVLEALYYGAWPVLAYGVGLCCYILSTDSAPGVRAFWKSRPPQGTSIAVAKLALTGTFVVLLPALCAWLVSLLPGASGAGESSLPMKTGYISLWSMGIAAWSCAGYSSWGRALVRLASGIAPFYIISLIHSPNIYDGWGRVMALSLTGLSFVLFFLGCGWTYFRSKQERAPTAKQLCLISLAPYLALVPGLVWYNTNRSWRRPPPPPAGEPFLANVSLGMPPPDIWAYPRSGNGTNESCWQFVLSVEGLPEDCTAYGSWINLELTRPDGRVIKSLPANENPLSGNEGTSFRYSPRPEEIMPRSGLLLTTSVCFLDSETDGHFMEPMRLDGVCRLYVKKRKITSVPLPTSDGDFTSAPGMSVMMNTEKRDYNSQTRLGPFAVREIGSDWSIWWMDSGLHHFECQMQKIYKGSSDFLNGKLRVFILEPQCVWNAPRIADAEYWRDVKAGRRDQWRLVRHHYEPVGGMDVKVSLPMVVVPFYIYDIPNSVSFEDRIHSLGLSEAEDTAADLHTVRQGLSLFAYWSQTDRRRGGKSPAPALSALLGKLGPRHVPGLLGLLEELLLPEEDWKYGHVLRFGNASAGKAPLPDRGCFDLLAARVFELLTPAEIPELRKNKRLYAALVQGLVERKLVHASEAGPGRYTDAEIQEEWHAGLNWGLLREDILCEAVVRGLPWVPGELAIIAEDHSSEKNVAAICAALANVSTCPAEHKPGIAWLKENAARLRWDATDRRWLVPATP